MFGLEIGLQMASFAVMLVLTIVYFSHKRLHLLSDQCFKYMLIIGIFNLICDMCTVYTVSHLEVVGMGLNRFAHQLFIGSIDTEIFLFFLYVEFLGSRKSPYRKGLLLSFIPYIASIFFVVFSPLYYNTSVPTPYSYGPMVYTIYSCMFAYIVIIFVDTWRYSHSIDHKRLVAIRRAIYVWIAACVIQGAFPQIFLSGLASGIMILFIFISFEDQKGIIDETSEQFNKRAYHKQLKENLLLNKSFHIIHIMINDLNEIYGMYGRDVGNEILKQVYQYISNYYKKDLFISRSSMISVFTNETLTEDFFTRFFSPWEYNGKQVLVSVNAYEMSVKKDVSAYDEVLNLMNYMEQESSNYPNNSSITIDHSIIDQMHRYHTIQSMIKNAINTDGFKIVIQPIYSIQEKKYNSGEVLIRFKDEKTHGYISPEEFIKIAEDTGYIYDVDMIVFEKLCRFIKEYSHDLNLDYYEINLSGKQIINQTISKDLYELIQKYQIDPKYINLEITETVPTQNKEIVYQNIERLKKYGFGFSIDDFGTGYSNIAKITGDYYDIVKIDKSLITPCFKENSNHSRIILRDIIHLIQNVGVKVLCEGVETEEQVHFLDQFNIDYIQGFYFSKPLDLESFIQFIKEHN